MHSQELAHRRRRASLLIGSQSTIQGGEHSETSPHNASPQRGRSVPSCPTVPTPDNAVSLPAGRSPVSDTTAMSELLASRAPPPPSRAKKTPSSLERMLEQIWNVDNDLLPQSSSVRTAMIARSSSLNFHKKAPSTTQSKSRRPDHRQGTPHKTNTISFMNDHDDIIHIICILWGDKYQEEDVNRLCSMVRRNTSHTIRFHIFTNEPLPLLAPGIVRHPEPGLLTDVDHSRYNYRKEAALCDEHLGGLEGKRVFFFDLDVLIVGNLDPLFKYPKDDKFYIINDWNTRGNHVGQASCYSFVVGTLGEVKSYFEKNSHDIIKKFGTASQEYLSEMVIRKQGKLEFWPDTWCKSFRFHCLRMGLLRHFLIPRKPPAGTKVLAFHGHPDMQDALEGRWSPPSSIKAAKGWKRIYKVCRPTLWIRDYWK